MKNVSNDFKVEIKKLGKQQKVKIEFENTTLSNEDINSITYSYNIGLLKSIMTELEINSNIEIPKNTEITFQYGLKVNNTFEYINYGSFIVYSVEKQEDTNSYEIIAYDKMLYAMKDYEEVNVQYPCTIEQYLQAIATKLGLSYTNSQFPNSNKQIAIDYYKNIGYTYRDVLDDICEICGRNIIVKNNELKVTSFINTEEIIDEENLKDINVNFGEFFGPVNSIVLSRSESDNIYTKDDQSIQENGLCEIKITDNQIMNNNDRSDYIQAIYNELHNLSFGIYDYSSTGIMYLEPLDRYKVRIGDNIYNCIMFNDEQNITQGLEENIYTENPEKSKTDYTKADKTDQRINQTNLIVDKQAQQIQSLITQVGDRSDKTTSITQDIDRIDLTVSDIEQITSIKESTGILTFDNINQAPPVYVRLYPIGYDITALYPHSGLYPNNELYPRVRGVVFHNISTGEYLNLRIPKDLYYLDGTHYDEYVLDYENQECYIIHRVQLVNGTKTAIADTKEILTYPNFEITTGDYEVYCCENHAKLKVKLMIQNAYTKSFATNVQLQSQIEQTTRNITSTVSELYETKADATQKQNNANDRISSVEQTANSVSIDLTRFEQDQVSTNGITQETLKEITDQIKFENGEVTIAGLEDGSIVGVRLVAKKNKIAFMNGSTETAYIDGNGEFHFTNGSITLPIGKQLDLGNWHLVPRSNGNLSLKYY